MFAPRALACSYSSRTTAPAPSPSTKPSRSLSHGRLALASRCSRPSGLLTSERGIENSVIRPGPVLLQLFFIPLLVGRLPVPEAEIAAMAAAFSGPASVYALRQASRPAHMP